MPRSYQLACLFALVGCGRVGYDLHVDGSADASDSSTDASEDAADGDLIDAGQDASDASSDADDASIDASDASTDASDGSDASALETCDGTDEDGDGFVDEGLLTMEARANIPTGSGTLIDYSTSFDPETNEVGVAWGLGGTLYVGFVLLDHDGNSVAGPVTQGSGNANVQAVAPLGGRRWFVALPRAIRAYVYDFPVSTFTNVAFQATGDSPTNGAAVPTSGEPGATFVWSSVGSGGGLYYQHWIDDTVPPRVDLAVASSARQFSDVDLLPTPTGYFVTAIYSELGGVNPELFFLELDTAGAPVGASFAIDTGGGVFSRWLGVGSGRRWAALYMVGSDRYVVDVDFDTRTATPRPTFRGEAPISGALSYLVLEDGAIRRHRVADDAAYPDVFPTTIPANSGEHGNGAAISENEFVVVLRASSAALAVFHVGCAP